MSRRSDEMYPKDGTYRVNVERCNVNSCKGELAEIAYYERDNWVAVELQRDRCRRNFTMKVEM
jgi:hypothetical protein